MACYGLGQDTITGYRRNQGLLMQVNERMYNTFLLKKEIV